MSARPPAHSYSSGRCSKTKYLGQLAIAPRPSGAEVARRGCALAGSARTLLALPVSPTPILTRSYTYCFFPPKRDDKVAAAALSAVAKLSTARCSGGRASPCRRHPAPIGTFGPIKALPDEARTRAPPLTMARVADPCCAMRAGVASRHLCRRAKRVATTI